MAREIKKPLSLQPGANAGRIKQRGIRKIHVECKHIASLYAADSLTSITRHHLESRDHSSTIAISLLCIFF